MTLVQERAAAKARRQPALTGTARFEKHESRVRLYCRKFPAVFTSAKNSRLYAEGGRVFIDFFSGAGTLNYGHNHDAIKSRLLDYIARDGIMHGLDFHTEARRAVISAFQDRILAPRGLAYKMQFPPRPVPTRSRRRSRWPGGPPAARTWSRSPAGTTA